MVPPGRHLLQARDRRGPGPTGELLTSSLQPAVGFPTAAWFSTAFVRFTGGVTEG